MRQVNFRKLQVVIFLRIRVDLALDHIRSRQITREKLGLRPVPLTGLKRKFISFACG